jgi:signal transduction histidine kinase
MRIGTTKAEQKLIAELCHQINSPLAAIRNALYLSATRSHDPKVLRYLTLANAEISSIVGILRQARIILEQVPCLESERGEEHRGQRHSRRAAA